MNRKIIWDTSGLIRTVLIFLAKQQQQKKKMSSYKLSYFNFPGVAEPIRFLLSYLNIDFEDYRFEFEQWPSIKQSKLFFNIN